MIGTLREVLPFCCLVTERLRILQMGGGLAAVYQVWFSLHTPTSFTLLGSVSCGVESRNQGP